MILAPIQDRTLRNVVRRAALPDEDVFHRKEDVRRASRMGYPRLLVCEADNRRRIRDEFGLDRREIPVLAIGSPTVRSWETAWEGHGLALNRIDDSALRLRRLIGQSAIRPDWTEGVYSDLTKTLGRGLPLELKGFSRRIMELPVLYSSLGSLGQAFGLSPGALKGRFRRRGLPSPSRYLRWFRLLAAARVLADPDETILTASFRLGFASDGNFCRWVRANSGNPPSALRDRKGRTLLLLRMTEDCFPDGSLDGWDSLGRLFSRQVA
jgi:AraC-like DNA-binding protein